MRSLFTSRQLRRQQVHCQRGSCGVVPASALCVSALSAATPAQQQPQQTQQPVFRTTTRLIVQTVTVKDKDGKVIEGLTAKDFTVTEDGQPQDIAFVEFQRMGGSTPAQAPAAAANTQTPAPAVAPEPATAPPAAANRSNPQPRPASRLPRPATSAIRIAGCWCSTSTARRCRRPIRSARTRTR